MLKALCLWLRLCTSISGEAYVIDGDTIVVDHYHIRLEGLDAEEMNEPYGPDARQAMLSIVRGHDVSCEFSGDRSYKRYVATCFVNGKDIAETLIALGYALDCAHYSKGKYRRFEPPSSRSTLIQKNYCW